ncbi:MAG: AsmA-like C-terminal region-containing protein [Desulfobacteraceae bacterium]|jgi:hypothetical protein
MKFSKNISKYIILSGIFFLLIISLFTLATVLIHKPGVQQYLLKKVCIGYGLETSTGEMELDFFGASGVVIHDVETCLKDKSCNFTISSITVNFSKLRLLTGELIPVSVDIKHPVIKIPEEKIKSLKNKKDGGRLRMPILCRDGINRFNIEDGEIIIAGPSGFAVNNLSAVLEHVEETSNTYKISGSAKIRYKGEESGFTLESTIDLNPDDILKSVFSASLITGNTPLAWIPSYKKIDFKKGHVKSNLNITNDPLNGVRLGGFLKFKSAGFILFHKDRSKTYDIPEVNGTINASMKDQVMRIDSLNMKNRDLDIDMDMDLDLTDRKNPDLKLTAKSKFMSIETFRRNFPFQITKPWLRDKLFPMFEEGQVRMDKLMLDGTIDQFRHIKDEGNHSIFAMSLTCKSFIVSNMGIQIPVTGVSASVDIQDGNLKISGLSGIFGSSEIKEGSLDVDKMIGGPRVFTVFADGDFDIRELMSLRNLNVMPEKARLRIEEYSELDGRLTTGATIGYRKGWEAPWTIGGDFSFRDTLFHKRYLELPLRFTQIDFHFPEESDNIFSGQGSFGNTQFGVTGITEFTGTRIIFKHAGITADADMNQLVKGCSKSDKFPSKFRESLPLEVIIDRQEDANRYSGSIDTEKLVMESDGIILHAGGKGNSVSFDLLQHDSGKLDINRAQFKLGNSGLLLSGEYRLTDKKLKALMISSGDLSLGDLGIQFKETENVLFGRLKGSLDFAFPKKDMKGMQINGNLIGNNISFIPGFLPLPVSGCSFRLDLSGKKGFINQLDMKFGEHPLRVKGILHGWDTLKGDLLVTSDYINLTEIIMKKGKKPANKTSSRKKTLFKTYEYDINLKLNSTKGIWQKLEFNRLNAEIGISDKNFTIKNAQAELERGDVAFSGTIGRKVPKIIDISGKVNLINQSVEKLISDTGFGGKDIKGNLVLKSSVDIKGNADDGILKNLSGKIDSMLITKGLIKNSKVFLKILDGLNIPDKFSERPPEMREEGFYFKRIEGTGLIEKGILKTEEFVIKSPVFNAVGSGEENLYKQTHNIRLLVQPLNSLDYIINKIPFVGRIISDDNETIFTVGYDVEGSWSKPDMDLVPSENLKSLWGVLKRAVRTPIRLLENLSNASKKSKKKTEPEVIDDMSSTEDNAAIEAENP